MALKDPVARRAYFREWQRKNRAKVKGYQAAWYQEHRERILGQQHQDRLEALQHYSRGKLRCRCCGEDGYLFLTLDHTRNDGKEHRLATRATQICTLLKRQGWPKGFQVLCYNCNFGRAKNGGICPHKET